MLNSSSHDDVVSVRRQFARKCRDVPFQLCSSQAADAAKCTCHCRARWLRRPARRSARELKFALHRRRIRSSTSSRRAHHGTVRTAPLCSVRDGNKPQGSPTKSPLGVSRSASVMERSTWSHGAGTGSRVRSCSEPIRRRGWPSAKVSRGRAQRASATPPRFNGQ